MWKNDWDFRGDGILGWGSRVYEDLERQRVWYIWGKFVI